MEKKVIVLLMIIFLSYPCFAQGIKPEQVLEKMAILEKDQKTDNDYLQSLRREIDMIIQRMTERNGAFKGYQNLITETGKEEKKSE